MQNLVSLFSLKENCSWWIFNLHFVTSITTFDRKQLAVHLSEMFFSFFSICISILIWPPCIRLFSVCLSFLPVSISIHSARALPLFPCHSPVEALGSGAHLSDSRSVICQLRLSICFASFLRLTSISHYVQRLSWNRVFSIFSAESCC